MKKDRESTGPPSSQNWYRMHKGTEVSRQLKRKDLFAKKRRRSMNEINLPCSDMCFLVYGQ